MRKLSILLVLPLLAACGNSGSKQQATAKVWLGEAKSPALVYQLDPAFARALNERDGQRISAGFTLLEDDVADEEIGRVVFDISGVSYIYPVLKCQVPQDGTFRFIWYGPQNDMRLQMYTRDALLVNLGACIQKKTPSS